MPKKPSASAPAPSPPKTLTQRNRVRGAPRTKASAKKAEGSLPPMPESEDTPESFLAPLPSGLRAPKVVLDRSGAAAKAKAPPKPLQMPREIRPRGRREARLAPMATIRDRQVYLRMTGPGGREVRRSEDGGVTWETIAQIPEGVRGGHHATWRMEEFAVAYSHDSGKTWSRIKPIALMPRPLSGPLAERLIADDECYNRDGGVVRCSPFGDRIDRGDPMVEFIDPIEAMETLSLISGQRAYFEFDPGGGGSGHLYFLTIGHGPQSLGHVSGHYITALEHLVDGVLRAGTFRRQAIERNRYVGDAPLPKGQKHLFPAKLLPWQERALRVLARRIYATYLARKWTRSTHELSVVEHAPVFPSAEYAHAGRCSKRSPLGPLLLDEHERSREEWRKKKEAEDRERMNHAPTGFVYHQTEHLFETELFVDVQRGSDVTGRANCPTFPFRTEDAAIVADSRYRRAFTEHLRVIEEKRDREKQDRRAKGTEDPKRKKGDLFWGFSEAEVLAEAKVFEAAQRKIAVDDMLAASGTGCAPRRPRKS